MILTQKTIKVGIVDDSPFMRKLLTDILNSDKGIEVIATAKNGKEAIEMITTLKPDIITLDIEMPIMNGIDTLKYIMEYNPLPVVMLSSLTYTGGAATITALELGAVDFIQKPSSIFMINGENSKAEIIRKVKNSYRAKVIHSPIIPCKVNCENVTRPNKALRNAKGDCVNTIVAIATSTGGPRALQSIIPLIPKHFPGAFLIVQHMPPGFTKSLAERLNSISEVTVKEAEDSEKIETGHVYIAPGNYHLGVKKDYSNQLYIDLSQEPPILGHRPSADLLFKSLSQGILTNTRIIGVIMTGMGSDGTKGLKALKEKASPYIIAQSEESCVVYGMPKSAVNSGVVDEIVPLEGIMEAIVNRVGVS
ncbi:protein-glutamate methylesterase/protein-glutamine glutaminase [Natronincola ferrireducens]|uniref:Protein-glutamate methylesterase/protein-glutamine glutaminase n=1 Tax=Natronincola ferrireducens TaxID=393762 RepID=A0A1G9C362_9FIRM|nr:chemotaxis response regulator protein-glutamate methylesterase [Natronincola ferrireducens]SDK46097.1 two-component system, chemotaxis family, response regulator CheB [Natronincola ferrireducens]